VSWSTYGKAEPPTRWRRFSTRVIGWRPFHRQGLAWSARGSHSFDLYIRRRRWPPFHSTALFLPRFVVRLGNRGDDLDWASVQVEVAPFEGDLAKVDQLGEGWTIAEWWDLAEGWREGVQRNFHVFHVRLEGRALPRPGTYVMRISVLRWTAVTSLAEEVRQDVEESVGAADANAIAAALPRALAESDVDEEALVRGQFRGRPAYVVTVSDYIRVEPFSNVLNFGLVVGTLVTALATIALAIVALVQG
jgi:hypothetical protein